MNKKSCIQLINAIRLRKKDFRGKDGDISYEVWYKKSTKNRNYGDRKNGHSINLAYDECGLLVRFLDGQMFSMTCVYGHQITSSSNTQGTYSLEQIERYHSREVFIPHACPGHPTILNGAISGYPESEDFAYQAGFYAAAFFYALNIKNPAIKLFNKEWIIEDSNLGQFDFFSYFGNHQVIPISLPFPKLIDETNTDPLKLAEGVELIDYIVNEVTVRQDLDDIRAQIYQN